MGEAKTIDDLSAVANNAGDNQDLKRNDELAEDSDEIIPVETQVIAFQNLKKLQKSGAVRSKEAYMAHRRFTMSVLRHSSHSEAKFKFVSESEFWSNPLDLNKEQTALDVLGYGLVSYFNLISMFFKLFLLLSLVNLPLMLGYGQFDAFAHE